MWDLWALYWVLILGGKHLKWQVFAPLILESSILQVAWHPFFFHKLSSPLPLFIFLFFHPFHSSLWYHACLLILVITCLYSSYVPSISAIYFHHHNHHIVFFSLPSKSEHSHLFNHLVKFVSSENLLWVLTLNC